LTNAFQKYFENAIEKEDIDKMFYIIDVSGSNLIEYSEFMLACIPEKVLLTNENMAVVFKVFDEDGSGIISKEEIKKVMSLGNKAISDDVSKQIME
jgi:calcium-dependent protein kinase